LSFVRGEDPKGEFRRSSGMVLGHCDRCRRSGNDVAEKDQTGRFGRVRIRRSYFQASADHDELLCELFAWCQRCCERCWPSGFGVLDHLSWKRCPEGRSAGVVAGYRWTRYLCGSTVSRTACDENRGRRNHTAEQLPRFLYRLQYRVNGAVCLRARSAHFDHARGGWISRWCWNGARSGTRQRWSS